MNVIINLYAIIGLHLVVMNIYQKLYSVLNATNISSAHHSTHQLSFTFKFIIMVTKKKKISKGIPRTIPRPNRLYMAFMVSPKLTTLFNFSHYFHCRELCVLTILPTRYNTAICNINNNNLKC